MLISDEKKFIFIHIPKTAGSSIRSTLQPYSIPKQTSKLLKHFNLPSNYQKFSFRLHASLQDAENKIPNDIFTSYKKIAFVRNPWDRLVSTFAYKVHGTDDKDRNRNDSFEKFIHREFKRKDRQQAFYLLNRHGKLACDFIGRFESLSEDYNEMQVLLNIPLSTLPQLNASKRQNTYRDYYTPQTKELVAKYYQDDIKLFGYDF